MGEQGIDPTPTPPHPLVVASEALDAAVANSGGLLEVLRRDQKRQRAVMRRVNVVVGVLVVAVLVLIYALSGIAHNASQIENERRARHVFCTETNFNNALARVALIDQFPDVVDAATLNKIAALLFPTRDCTQDPPVVIGTVEIGVLPPSPTTG